MTRRRGLGWRMAGGIALLAPVLLSACEGGVDLTTPDPSVTVPGPTLTIPTLPGVPTTPTLPVTLPPTLPPITTAPPTTTTTTTTAPPITTTTTVATTTSFPPQSAAESESDDSEWDPGPPSSVDDAMEGFGDSMGSALFIFFVGLAGAIAALFALPLTGCGMLFFPILPLAFFLSVILTALLGAVGFVLAIGLTYAIARWILVPRARAA